MEGVRVRVSGRDVGIVGLPNYGIVDVGILGTRTDPDRCERDAEDPDWPDPNWRWSFNPTGFHRPSPDDQEHVSWQGWLLAVGDRVELEIVSDQPLREPWRRETAEPVDRRKHLQLLQQKVARMEAELAAEDAEAD